jgi:hypothetical protein
VAEPRDLRRLDRHAERDALTASDVHQAVQYRPITRYDLVGGYTNLPGLTALAPTKEDRP